MFKQWEGYIFEKNTTGSQPGSIQNNINSVFALTFSLIMHIISYFIYGLVISYCNYAPASEWVVWSSGC